jgi:hypothetical protein
VGKAVLRWCFGGTVGRSEWVLQLSIQSEECVDPGVVACYEDDHVAG